MEFMTVFVIVSLGFTKLSMEYRACRCSVLAVFPAFGNAKSSVTAMSTFVSTWLRSMKVLNTDTAPILVAALLDLALFTRNVVIRLHCSASIDEEYARKKLDIAGWKK